VEGVGLEAVPDHFGRVVGEEAVAFCRLGDGVQDLLAGFGESGALEQTDAAIARSIASNLTGTLLGCSRAAAIMQKQGSGLIVNIGSACSTHAWPGWSVYSAAKAGVLQFTRCLLTELRPHGVRVTSVLPSWGQTDFTASANLPPREPEVLEKCISPEDLGNLIVEVARMPSHLVTEEIKLWPMVQPMTQL
jgi:short-subunit dehydrogenase